MDYWLRPDALAIVRSARHFRLHRCDDADAVLAFVTDYGRAREELASSEPRSDSDWLSCRDIVEAVEVIKSNEAIELVANDYCLFVATQLPQAKPVTNLSEREHRRLYRSLYRYQVWCNFMGPQGVWTPPNKYLPTFPPWEIQEMVCVWQYLMKRWRVVFREISGIVPNECRYGHGGYTSLTAELEHLRTSQDDSSDDSPRVKRAQRAQNFLDRRQYIVHRGPVFLARALSQRPLEKRCDFLLVEALHHYRVIHKFEEVLLALREDQHLLPPANRYEDPDIVAQLSRMAAAERPGRGWEWFCNEYHIPSLGIGLYWEQCFINSFQHPNNMPQYMAKQAPRWGLFYWDEEILEEWGVIVTEEAKEEQERKRARDIAAIDGRETEALMDSPGLFMAE